MYNLSVESTGESTKCKTAGSRTEDISLRIFLVFIIKHDGD